MRKASGVIDKLTPFGDGFIRFEFFEDGWTEDEDRHQDLDQYLLQLELVGKQVIPQMIKKNAEQGRPVCCLINNPFIPWVTDVATTLGLPSAMLWVQSCACFASYYHYYHGTVPFPDEEHPEIDVQLPCMPLLKHDEVPSFLHPTTPYPFLRRAILAEAAVAEGGSSDWNIRHFTDDIVKANESEIAGKCNGSNEFPVSVVVKSIEKVVELVGSSA
uniref:Limonoid UDP-glucosyltransferase-like n=1 Tax=Populus alba TaxID=43335 RepID=A0A4U5N9B4_POPAL|nr:limonoid UDP-glucosyltransferase-like [Populus alba]